MNLYQFIPYGRHIHIIIFSLLSAGACHEREKVTPAVGIVFNDEEKIYNLSGSYSIASIFSQINISQIWPSLVFLAYYFWSYRPFYVNPWV
ncbi:MAG: hypothetical protein ACP5JU_04245, partial [Minisyncoccia bacterium]